MTDTSLHTTVLASHQQIPRRPYQLSPGAPNRRWRRILADQIDRHLRHVRGLDAATEIVWAGVSDLMATHVTATSARNTDDFVAVVVRAATREYWRKPRPRRW